MNNLNTAILLIDIQSGMFNIPQTKLHRPKKFLKVIKNLIDYGKEKDCPIIYIQHESSGKNSILHSSQPGWIIHPAISPTNEDRVIQKKFSDSFKDTNLDEILKDLKVETLIIGGLQTELCVDTTIRSAFSKNYDVIIIKEGHSTFDTKLLKADQIIKHHNNIFNNRFGKVISIKKLK